MVYSSICYVDISRVSDQNGVSLLYIMLEIHHSGREPSICTGRQPTPAGNLLSACLKTCK